MTQEKDLTMDLVYLAFCYLLLQRLPHSSQEMFLLTVQSFKSHKGCRKGISSLSELELGAVPKFLSHMQYLRHQDCQVKAELWYQSWNLTTVLCFHGKRYTWKGLTWQQEKSSSMPYIWETGNKKRLQLHNRLDHFSYMLSNMTGSQSMFYRFSLVWVLDGCPCSSTLL